MKWVHKRLTQEALAPLATTGPSNSLFYYGNCNVNHFVEYDVSIGIDLYATAHIRAFNYEFDVQFTKPVFTIPMLSGCLLSQVLPSENLTLQFARIPPYSTATIERFVLEDLLASFSNFESFQFPRIRFVNGNVEISIMEFNSKNPSITRSAIQSDLYSPSSQLLSPQRKVTKDLVRPQITTGIVTSGFSLPSSSSQSSTSTTAPSSSSSSSQSSTALSSSSSSTSVALSSSSTTGSEVVIASASSLIVGVVSVLLLLV